MAKIKPFKAVRPVPDKVHLVASRSYVSYEPEKLLEKLDSNPYTFIHIINPDYDHEDKAKAGTSEMFSKVKAKYCAFKEEGIFFKEEEDSIYVYQQTTDRGTYSGIVAGVSVEEYKDKTIKIHEATIERREKLFTEYLDSVDFNAEPVLIAHEKNEGLDQIISEVKTTAPLYDFTTADTYRHTLWKISDLNTISEIQQRFSEINQLYIADGHHRSASSANLGSKRNHPNPMCNSHWFLALLTQEDQMKISGFHRLIHGLEKSESDRIIKEINRQFKLEPITDQPLCPAPGNVHLYYFGTGWVKFTLNPSDSQEPKDLIDAERLSAQVLRPIVGIKDLKKDQRVTFIPDTGHLKSVTGQLDDGNDILFLLAPATFEQLKAVADADQYMPPKSTYIEPKLRSGLTIFEISDE